MKKYFIAVCIACILAPSLRSQPLPGDAEVVYVGRSAAAQVLTLKCETVDTLFANLFGDEYIGSPFVMKVTITNTGTEVVDDVEATLIISDAALQLIGMPIVDIGSIGPQASKEVMWDVLARPQPQATDVNLIVSVSAANHSMLECQSRVHLTALPQPELNVHCFVEPSDTLYYNERTGRFELSELRMIAAVMNSGEGEARRIRGMLLLQENMSLSAGEMGLKFVNPQNLGTAETGHVEWKVQLLQVRGNPEWVEFEVLVTLENGPPVKCMHRLYLRPVSRHVVLAMPENSILRHGNEQNIPVRIEGAAGLRLSRYVLRIKYDPGLLRINGVYTAGTLTADGWTTHVDVSGVGSPMSFGDSTVTIRAQGTAIDANEGILVNLRVEGVLPSRHGAGDFRYSRLKMDTVQSFLEGGWISFSAVDGGVYVTDDCLEALSRSAASRLSQNRPNPFNPSTVIEYVLPEKEYIRLRVFDRHGRDVAVLFDGMQDAGRHTVSFDAENLSSGMYFYRLETARGIETKKMVLMR